MSYINSHFTYLLTYLLTIGQTVKLSKAERSTQKCGVERWAQAYNKNLRAAALQRRPGTERQGSVEPLNAENSLAFGCPIETENLPHSQHFANSKTDRHSPPLHVLRKNSSDLHQSQEKPLAKVGYGHVHPVATSLPGSRLRRILTKLHLLRRSAVNLSYNMLCAMQTSYIRRTRDKSK